MLLTIVGLSLGWVAAQLKWIRDRHEALESRRCIRVYGVVPPPPSAPWSIRILGEEGISVISVYSKTLMAIYYRGDEAVSGGEPDQERLRDIKQLFPEAEVTYYDDPAVFGDYSREPRLSLESRAK